MKTPEDEAFDELARKQGAWGGGFKAKQAMAADKLQEPAHCQCPACKDGIIHASDCAVHNGPAYSLGPCDCGVEKTRRRAMDEDDDDIQVYKKPWVGLTVQERNDCLVQADPCECLADPEAHQLMVEVEAKLRSKNT
jgi:hypothetical protein